MANPKKKSAKQARDVVISFRITPAQSELLAAIHKLTPAYGVRTPEQRARKVLCDFLDGRLSYTKPDDAKRDFFKFPVKPERTGLS